MKPVLPAGTVISYLGVKAVVIKDGPTEFLVSCEGNHESWWWECDGHTCEIVAYPSGSTHQPTPDVSVLVGALERIERMDFDDHSLFNAVLVARAALAAHRKQGGAFEEKGK